MLAAANGRHVQLRDIAAATGLLKTTAFNLVTALADTGLAEREPQRGYRLGLHALIYGRVVERQLMSLRSFARIWCSSAPKRVKRSIWRCRARPTWSS
jgi:DNA-binding IclR family transcriptional regulator